MAKCPTPQKVKYKTQENCEKAITRILTENEQEYGYAYKCRCGMWHWSSQKKKLSNKMELRLQKMKKIKQLFGTNRAKL